MGITRQALTTCCFKGICLLLLCVFSRSTILLAQQVRIDEDFSDWAKFPTLFEDKKNDGGFVSIDFSKISAANDSINVYLYLELGREMSIQAANNLRLNIDLDNNALTGNPVGGLGIDFQYNFGAKKGTYFVGSSSFALNQSIVGLVTSPTVTSDRFELAIQRKMLIGGKAVEIGNSIRFFVEDAAVGGDRAPDEGGATYLLQPQIAPYVQNFRFEKSPDDVRVLSYNVERDNLFNFTAKTAFGRLFKSITPDIFCLQEIYDHSGLETRDVVAGLLGSAANEWYYDEINPDIRIVSKFPIVNKQAIDGNGAFLVDLGVQKLLVIIAHLPCCENETNRQKECDKIMAFVRTAKLQQGSLPVAQNTPIILCGDMNLVGLRFQQQTLITGDILDESTFGADFNPDWDDSKFEDAKPPTTGLSTDFTWKTDGTFSPGRLDYILYSGSQLRLNNSFTLFTPALPVNTLAKYGLSANDVTAASDHLPLVADFAIQKPNLTAEPTPAKFRMYPNPTQGQVSLAFEGMIVQYIEFSLTGSDGKVVYQSSQTISADPLTLELPSNILSGTYQCLVKTENKTYRTSLVIQR